MQVSGIAASFSAYTKRVAPGAGQPSAAPSAIASAQQEATETTAVTQREAQNGDRVAIQKLHQQQTQKPTTPSTGHRVNYQA